MDLTLISRFIDSRTGGIGTYSQLLYEGLKKEDININVVTQEDSILPYTDNPVEYFFYSFFELGLILRKNMYKNSDVFHALSPMEAIRANKRKTVVTIHDVYDVHENKSIEDKILIKSINEALKCEKVVINKNELIPALKEYGGFDEDKISIIGPSISSNLFPKPKENDIFTVGTIARLIPRKRNDILIKSFLDANIENSQLLIAGKGSELDYLKKISKNDDRVKFLGFISDDEVNDFYNSLDVFVFPTIDEGYGMPIVEAMACEKPVITLEDAEITSIVKDRTFVTSQNDLADVLRDRTYSCDIKSNVEFYKQHSIERRSKQFLEIYKQI